MKTFLIPFLKQLIIFSLILGIIATGLAFLLPSRMVTPALPFQFVFFIAITILLFMVLISATKERFSRFLNVYLLITTGKLLLFLVILLIYIWLNKPDAMPFGITFFLLYICFTIFEVSALLRYTRKQNQQEPLPHK